MEKVRRMVNEIAYTQSLSALSPIHISLIPLLSLTSSLYKIVLSFRHHLYRYGVLRKHRLPVPVISVGNLTWGGNGKTPMVEFISNWLVNDVGISPLILTRGYGGGDEVKMLGRHLDGKSVKIGVGANRAATAAAFLQRNGYICHHDIECFKKKISRSHGVSDKIGVAILDDGMQHISMQRDLELVMVNAMSPWGNHQLLPLGPLREPLNSLSRADAVVVHHADLVSERSLSIIGSTIQKANQFLPVYFSGMIPSHFFKVSDVSCRFPLGFVSEMIVLCVSAIGSPNSFVQRIEKMGPLYVDRLDYSDHHQFQIEDINMMKRRLQKLQTKFASKPTVIVTEKDYDRDTKILTRLEPFEVLVLCSKLQIIPHNNCSEDSFKKLLTRSLS